MSNLESKKCQRFKENAPIIKLSQIKIFQTKILLSIFIQGNTPGCTTEGQVSEITTRNLKNMIPKFLVYQGIALNHTKTLNRNSLFLLNYYQIQMKKCVITFDVMKMKSMYGKQYLGVDRSTFLIDKAGKVKEWRSVKVKVIIDSIK